MGGAVWVAAGDVSAVERSRWNVSLSNIEAMAHALDVQAWMLIKPPEEFDR